MKIACIISALVAAACVAGVPLQAQASARALPGVGALAFGTSAKIADRMLGKPTIDGEADFVWRAYPIDHGQIRLAFSRDRLSQFSLFPDKPISWPVASAWAHAFLPGLENGRQIHQDPARWLIFQTFVLYGRPFEAELHFERAHEQVVSMGGEIHWLD
jgi:hypothetical protein